MLNKHPVFVARHIQYKVELVFLSYSSKEKIQAKFRVMVFEQNFHSQAHPILIHLFGHSLHQVYVEKTSTSTQNQLISMYMLFFQMNQMAKNFILQLKHFKQINIPDLVVNLKTWNVDKSLGDSLLRKLLLQYQLQPS